MNNKDTEKRIITPERLEKNDGTSKKDKNKLDMVKEVIKKKQEK